MDASDRNVLHRQQYGYWTLWCRQFGYRSYRNVYAVYLSRDGDKMEQEVHRVHGSLGNGPQFAGFLIRSQVRRHAYAALSDAFCSGLKSKEKRGGNWVVVEADSAEAAMEHEDVCEVRDEMMGSDWRSAFCGVYFISNCRGAVKIGNTSASPLQRLATLQPGSPYPLKIVAIIHTTSHKRLEAELHERFAKQRLEGEWFSMSDDEAVDIALGYGGEAVLRRTLRSTLMPKCRA
jgi:hypothetical protein